jgi:hypothetical protein
MYRVASIILLLLSGFVQGAGSGVAVVAGESRDAYRSIKGYYSPDLWDVYWTGRQASLVLLQSYIFASQRQKPQTCNINTRWEENLPIVWVKSWHLLESEPGTSLLSDCGPQHCIAKACKLLKAISYDPLSSARQR